MIKAFTSPVAPVAKTAAWLQASGVVLVGSAFVAVCAQFSLPLYFTPVPLSMAPFAVLLLGLLLSPRLAAATLAAYLVEGAMGLPVFAPGPLAGPAHLIGPTAGYLLAYPLAAALISWLSRMGGRSFASLLVSATAGDVAILTSGAIWMAALTHATASTVFSLSVVPFLPGDALKIVAAAGLATSFQRVLPRKP